MCKTRRKNFSKIKEKVCEIHPYETPAIITFPIVAGSDDFLKWIDESVR